MLVSIMAGYVGALAAPLLYRAAPRTAASFCTGLPLALFLYFLSLTGSAGNGGIASTFSWVPSLGVDVSFRLDGLSLLFSLVITGIGSLVVFYSSAYLKAHHQLGRMYALILAFMASMLGLVLADNLVVLYVFWELTSITSYLLIGFNHKEDKSRQAALEALLVTGAGGLALLAGILILGFIGGSLEITQLMQQKEALLQHPLYFPALLLVLAGAFTKSAQFPFHFWLPSAMAAPTPVSTYLHSAAMVKAGVYLLARLAPVLGGSEAWHYSIAAVGLTTMLAGAVMSIPQEDLKRILAYTTVSALGTLMLLIGIGTEAAMQAFAVYLLAHVLYKASLFLVAGAVDHAAGTRELSRLGGLRTVLPLVTVAAALAAMSMAGMPPSFGYIGKELLYEAKLHAPEAAWLVTAAGVSANIAMVAAAAMVGFAPFFRTGDLPREPHSVSWKLWLGPLIPAAAGLIIGLFPGLVAEPFIRPAVAAVTALPAQVHLVLWSGFNQPFILGIVTLAGGAVLYALRSRIVPALPRQATFAGPHRMYRFLLDALLKVATVQTRLLQSGYLRVYLKVVLGTAVTLVAIALLRHGQIPRLGELTGIYLHEWLTGGVIIGGAITAASSKSRLAAVVALGAVGYGVSLVYLLFGAPDLAITQFCIETLTVILFVLVLYRLPRFSALSRRPARLLDMLVAMTGGIMMTLLVLLAHSVPLTSRISSYFAENSKMLAHGRNVVNVILVDFRALDTLGEITVLSVAAIGIYGLVKFSTKKE